MKKLVLLSSISFVLLACTNEQSSKPTETIVANEEKSEEKALAQIEHEAQLRMNNFVLPEGFSIKLWADETQTQNPAFFSFDSQGRMLMVETARFTQGVDDIRGHENKTVEDIYITSNEDRLALYQKYQDERPMSYYRGADDIIRLLQDTDKDGRADKSQVFSDGYNDVLDGIGAGVIERDGKVYYTNIPHLWMLEDTDNDGVADERVSLQDGFGIRISFYGHDLHGLIWGPDGKLYWSIGDRGFNVTTKEGNHFYGPNLGGVFRANPDGSDIEYFYNGLRNPQELAFDEYGNLFTADNDGDGGDMERINYLVEGGDSGWHAGHQSIMSFTERLQLRTNKYTGAAKIHNAWMTQDMWKPRNDKQPAFMLPGIGQINGGPSGLVYNPGTSFGEAFEDQFFVIHYLGEPTKSYISTFKVEPDGASFLMKDNKPFLSGFNAVDLDFGHDGRLYMSEYNYGGWQPENQGAVYVLQNDATIAQPEQYKVAEQEAILTSDFTQYDIDALVGFLSHRHMRIRQRAQFELAKRGDPAQEQFANLATDSNTPLLTRLHGIWGLSQMAFSHTNRSQFLDIVLTLLTDEDPEIRAQAARVMGDHKYSAASDSLRQMLADPNPRVVMYAGIGLGRLRYNTAINDTINALARYGDKDLWLRHGLVMALAGMHKEQWIKHANHASADVRMGVLLALRRSNDPRIADFLNDSEQAIVDEAITAINDQDIIAARAQLAKHLTKMGQVEGLDKVTDPVDQWQHHRVINANYNQGSNEDAARLLDYITQPELPTVLAAEALAAIEAWNDINPIDNTTGLPSRAVESRDDITVLIKDALPQILTQVQGQALVQSLRLADDHGVPIADEVLLAAVNNRDNASALRIQALTSLVNRQVDGLVNIVQSITSDRDSAVRGDALSKLFTLDKTLGIEAASRFLTSDNYADNQQALIVLSNGQGEVIDTIAKQQMQALLNNQLAAGAILETLDFARSRQNADISSLVNQYDERLQSADLMTQFASTLQGGNKVRGEEIFRGGGAGQCMRCHIVNYSGGDVGPDLSDIGAQHDRRYLLEAIINPSAIIAPGYGSVTLTLNSGELVSGIYMGETDSSIKLSLPDKTPKEYALDELADINLSASSMPPMHLLMDKKQIRDLVAYMASLKLEYEKVEDVH